MPIPTVRETAKYRWIGQTSGSPAFREFRITTEGFGELIWRPSASINQSLGGAVTNHPQGEVAMIAMILAELAEAISFTNGPDDHYDENDTRPRVLDAPGSKARSHIFSAIRYVMGKTVNPALETGVEQTAEADTLDWSMVKYMDQFKTAI